MKTTKKFLAVLLSVLMLFSSVAFVSSAYSYAEFTKEFDDGAFRSKIKYDTETIESVTDIRLERHEDEGYNAIYFTVTLAKGKEHYIPMYWYNTDAPIKPEIGKDGAKRYCMYTEGLSANYMNFTIRAVEPTFTVTLINSRFEKTSDNYLVLWNPGVRYGSTPEYTEPEGYRTEDGGIYEFVGWDIAVDGEFDGKVDAKKIENVKSDIYADAVFANVHDHNSNPGDENSCWELAEIKKATCTEDGAYKYICGRCSEGVTKEVKIPSRGGHTMSLWTEVIVPTCTKSGYRVRMCMNIVETDLYKACDHREFENVNPIDHSYGEWKTVLEPTCTEKGRAERVCTREGCDAKQYKDIDPIGHNYGEWVTVLEPTCTEKGKAERTCKNDASHKEYKDLDATGKHVDNDGDKRCDHCGEEFGHCSDCICHQGNVLSYVMRYLCTFLSKVFHTELKCCECMEWYNGNISSIS